MARLEILDTLCELIGIQNDIIRALATRLAEIGDTETMQDELAKADDILKSIILDQILPF